jgi:hypothetical protein
MASVQLGAPKSGAWWSARTQPVHKTTLSEDRVDNGNLARSIRITSSTIRAIHFQLGLVKRMENETFGEVKRASTKCRSRYVGESNNLQNRLGLKQIHSESSHAK